MPKDTNIKRLSYILLALITLIFSLSAYDRAHNIYRHFQQENENYTRLIANSTSNYFRQIQMILDLVGNQLLDNENYRNSRDAKAIFDRMLQLNDSIVGYALIDPEGNYLLTQLDTPPEEIPNVLTRNAARDSFLQTLAEKRMVIGRTYFLNLTEKLVIPVRMPFYDRNGEPVAVMTIAIDAKDPDIFDASVLQSDASMIHLFREADRYRQLYIHRSETLDPHAAYDAPIPLSAYQQAMRQISDKAGTPLATVKQEQRIVSITYEDQLHDTQFLVSSRFIKELNLWATSYIRLSAIYTSIAEDMAKLILVYLVTAALLLFLFRRLEESEQHKKQDLEHQARHDSLTGLPNRRFLQQNAGNLLNGQQPKQLALFSIDDLKAIEDIYGHSIAEDFIRQFAQRSTRPETGKHHQLIQMGSDEFLLIRARISKDPTAEIAALKAALQHSLTCHGIPINFTLSMGVSEYPTDHTDYEHLIRFADMALQESRQERNQITLFNRDIEAAFTRRLMIESQIRTAIASGEFSLMYQPQIRYPDHIYGVEALVRWHNPQLGFISPAEFIPIAESSTLMPLLGEHIIEIACRDMGAFIRNHDSPFQLSLNISAKQFMHEGFASHLMHQVHRHGLSPERITLELTESIFIHDIRYLTQVLQQLRREGFKISMDDFGTGFSSLSMLRKIPLNEIKIDKSFVDDITEEASAEYVARTIILIGQQLDYEIILAEGAETREQVETLMRHGCNIFQGYYFSKPLTLDQLACYFNDHQGQTVS